MKLQKPKGTQDILPQESAKWQYLEEFARKTFKKYNYAEIRTPIFEHYEVISRSVGDTTDIVTKEMYDFYDRETVILRYGQKELRQSFVLMSKTSSLRQRFKSQLSFIIWALCSAMSGLRLVACANFTKSGWSASALKIQRQMQKRLLWRLNSSRKLELGR